LLNKYFGNIAQCGTILGFRNKDLTYWLKLSAVVDLIVIFEKLTVA